MNEDLEKILESLPEEEKNNFYEKVKKQAQDAVKKIEEQKKKEEEAKKFKASGHWETENDEIKISADIEQEDSKRIHFNIGSESEFYLDKNSFFNFAKMVEDIYEKTKEFPELKLPNCPSDSWQNYINEISKKISDFANYDYAPFRNTKIFHIR